MIPAWIILMAFFSTSTLSLEQRKVTMSTYNKLTRVNTWPAFSKHSVDDGGGTSNNLEAIHDGIHIDVGQQGHVADPAITSECNSSSVNLFSFLILSSAFNPIFFLLYCNIYRVLSWAALKLGKWVTPGQQEWQKLET